MAIFMVELENGAPGDFGAVTLSNVRIEASTSNTTW